MIAIIFISPDHLIVIIFASHNHTTIIFASPDHRIAIIFISPDHTIAIIFWVLYFLNFQARTALTTIFFASPDHLGKWKLSTRTKKKEQGSLTRIMIKYDLLGPWFKDNSQGLGSQGWGANIKTKDLDKERDHGSGI